MVDESTSLKLLVLFDTVTALSFVLIAAIVTTAYFSKHVHRPDVWYGQMVQWMIYCISYMLLFCYQRGPEPPRALCLLQASLIYSCPPTCAVGSACFMVNLYMSLSPLHRKSTRSMPKLNLYLIFLPWITLISSVLQVVLFSVNGNLNSVQRSPDGFFCNISYSEPTIVSVVLVFLSFLLWFYYEAQAGVIMFKNKQEFARLKHKTSRKFLSFYIRSATLNIGMLIATGITGFSLWGSTHGLAMGPSSVALPFMPIFVALVFGTQRDIMQVWVFWRNWRKQETEEASSLSSPFDLSMDAMLRSSASLG